MWFRSLNCNFILFWCSQCPILSRNSFYDAHTTKLMLWLWQLSSMKQTKTTHTCKTFRKYAAVSGSRRVAPENFCVSVNIYQDVSLLCFLQTEKKRFLGSSRECECLSQLVGKAAEKHETGSLRLQPQNSGGSTLKWVNHIRVLL